MIKKLLFAGLLTGSVGMNFYLLNSEVIVHDDLDSDLIELDDEITIAQSAIQKPKITIKKNKKHIGEIRKDFLPEDKSEDVKASNDEHEIEVREVTEVNTGFDRGREKWKNLISETFEVEAGLDREVTEKYLELSKARGLAIDELLKPEFENLPKGETLFMSMETNIEISKINEKYLDLLRKEIGEDNYRLYKKTRMDFNQKSLEPNSDNFFIEF